MMNRTALIIIIACVVGIIVSPSALAISNLNSESSIGYNTITILLNPESPVIISDETPGYVPVPSTYTVSDSTYETIYIDNEDTNGYGIADTNGQVNVEFSLNDDRPFCIAVSHFDGDNSKLKMDVTINGIEYHYTSVLSGSITQYIGLTAKYFTLQTLIDEENWITSQNPIHISIHNFTGAQVPESVTLCILFV